MAPQERRGRIYGPGRETILHVSNAGALRSISKEPPPHSNSPSSPRAERIRSARWNVETPSWSRPSQFTARQGPCGCQPAPASRERNGAYCAACPWNTSAKRRGNSGKEEQMVGNVVFPKNMEMDRQGEILGGIEFLSPSVPPGHRRLWLTNLTVDEFSSVLIWKQLQECLHLVAKTVSGHNHANPNHQEVNCRVIIIRHKQACGGWSLPVQQLTRWPQRVNTSELMNSCSHPIYWPIIAGRTWSNDGILFKACCWFVADWQKITDFTLKEAKRLNQLVSPLVNKSNWPCSKCKWKELPPITARLWSPYLKLWACKAWLCFAIYLYQVSFNPFSLAISTSIHRGRQPGGLLPR